MVNLHRTFKNQYSGLLPIKNLPSSYELYGCYHRNFRVGAFVRDVKMPLSHWLGSGALLLLSSLVFLSFGLLLAQIKSQQIMAIVGNIVFLGLAIIGGSWMPVTMFPKWVQHIPSGHPSIILISW